MRHDDEWFEATLELYRLDPETGRRVYREGVLSRPKGRAKSEFAGQLSNAEAFGPVRFDGWDANGQPVGRPVTSPLIKCLATEEEQAGNTFEVIAFIACEWGPDMHPEIYGGVTGARQYQSATAIYLPHGGEIRACTAGAASKDGGKESFVVADETHLYVLRELRAMYATIKRNLKKRKLTEPWLLQTTTAYRPGEQSIAEQTLTAWRKGELLPEVLVNHREAKGKIDLQDRDKTIRQLAQVYGVAADWMDLEGIYSEMIDPRSCPDDATAARYFFNRAISGSDAWIPKATVDRQAAPQVVEAGESICVGFDGSLNDDSTVLIGCRMSDGFLFPIGIWSKPVGPNAVWWEVPRSDVLAAIHEAYSRYEVVRGYFDPHEWRSDIDQLALQLGESRVSPWSTHRDRAMSAALDRLRTDLLNGSVWHSGDGEFVEHFGNAYLRRKGSYRLVRKEYDNSSRKIDSVVGAALAYEARADALTEGWTADGESSQVICFR